MEELPFRQFKEDKIREGSSFLAFLELLLVFPGLSEKCELQEPGGKLSAGRQTLHPGGWVLTGEIFLLNLSFKALVRVLLGHVSSYFTISSLQLDLGAWKLE
ncbi:hypothetical protein Tco_0864890 [Tanacetum coccineum]